jgi:hypothetical protein
MATVQRSRTVVRLCALEQGQSATLPTHPPCGSVLITSRHCPATAAGWTSSAALNAAKHVLKMILDTCDKYMIGVYDLEHDMFALDTVVEDRRLWYRVD